MPIRQLPSKSWQVRVWDTDSEKYASLGTYETKREAEKAELQWEAGVFDSPETAIKPKPIPKGRERFGKFALEVIQSRKHVLSRSTYHYHLWNLDAHLKAFHNTALGDITHSQIVKWWASMEDKPSSRKQSYGTLSMVMSRAVRLGRVTTSPCMIEGATKDKSKKRPTFHAADVRMLIALSNDTMMTASLWMLLGTGCRIGELLGLTWADVDLTTGRIVIDKHLTIHGVEEGTKSHPTGRRSLLMPPEAVEALRALSKTVVPMPDYPVFLNSRGSRLTYHKWRERFVKIKRACGLDDLQAHDLRHIHLTEFAKHATMREVMDRAGHSDYGSALRYQHSTEERESQIMERLRL